MAHKFEELAAPFPPEVVEWRVQSAGPRKDGNGIWVRVIPYLKAEAIMGRLDQCFGAGGWYSRVDRVQDGVLVAIGFQNLVTLGPDERVIVHNIERVDGAPIANAREDSDAADPFRTALSQAFKRAAKQWGIGRYLGAVGSVLVDPLPEGQRGKYRSEVNVKDANGQKRKVWVQWNPPSSAPVKPAVQPPVKPAPATPAQPAAQPAAVAIHVPVDFFGRRDLLIELLEFAQSMEVDWSRKHLSTPHSAGVSIAQLRGSEKESQNISAWFLERIQKIITSEQAALVSFDAWRKSRVKQ